MSTCTIGKHPGFRPKKSLGQHFLRDQQVIHKIIKRAGLNPSDLVLEIGPGKGALTFELARSARQVVAIEKDTILFEWLGQRLIQKGISNVTLINEDILQFDMEKAGFPASERFVVIGNLPYNISTPFLAKLIEFRRLVQRAVLMFQLEIAKRLTAAPGNKSYGAMSVMVQYHAQAIPLLEVPRGAFAPVPKVDSMVLALDFDKPHPNPVENEAAFERIVKGAFAHRRKTLLNSLKGIFPLLDRIELSQKIKSCGIDPGARAETLGIDHFICLCATLDIDTGDV